MAEVYDFAIIGSGPAGVSAAFPLVEAGHKVIMVDGGQSQDLKPPDSAYLSARYNDERQHEWMVGSDFFALAQDETGSPKLRTPTHKSVFKNFAKANKISTENFVAVGSMAPGGLSNAWGAGVARYSKQELAEFPFPASDLDRSYQTISQRIGISGASNDDLRDYFGLDEWAQGAIEMDEIHTEMLRKYESKEERISAEGMKMGRSRVAVLKDDFNGRKACDLSGNCMWGCDKKAIYTAVDDLAKLEQFKNFKYVSGFIVEEISQLSGKILMISLQSGKRRILTTTRLLLAAGTLASTRLALTTLGHTQPISVQSTPTAAFLLWFPGKLGAAKTDSFGLGQMSYALDLSDNISAFGSTFSSQGILASEFVKHLPFKRRFAIDFWRQISSSCVVGNVFLPGTLSTSTAQIDEWGHLHIKGGYSDNLAELLKMARVKLRRVFRPLGGFMLPKSFVIGEPGGDIHYSGTLPMRESPEPGETDPTGQIAGLKNIYAVDGASLPYLSEKSHTLTIMANADRIASRLAQLASVT